MPSQNSKKRDAEKRTAAGGPFRSGSAAPGAGGPFTLSIPGKTENLEAIRGFVAGVARNAGFGEDDVNKIELAVDEACSNVIEHAYSPDETKDIGIAVAIDRLKMTVTVTDHGRSFHFDGVPLPDMKQYLAELRVGGLGIYLMKMLMDEVEYRSESGRNEVRMSKYFKKKSRPPAAAAPA
jgi:serine/threonine-protein kinase RsbW